MIISLVNSKGGVGKSTLAGNLAGWLASHGRSVILAACGTQQSSSEWITEALPELPVVRLANADAVLDELQALAQEADFVIADGPGSQTDTSRALLMWADAPSPHGCTKMGTQCENCDKKKHNQIRANLAGRHHSVEIN